ncbi:MAG: hypothetical protein AAGM22_14310 [Acidobacteriota bacterium]
MAFPKEVVRKLVLAAVSAGVTYGLVGQALWLWNHRLSGQRLSTAQEIEAYHADGYSYGLYRYHPRRQVTLRPDHRGLRHGMRGLWMRTDSRGLAFDEALPEDGPAVLVLGDSVAFGSWVPYGDSFPGVLQREFPALRVFSGATESYSLRQIVDLYGEVRGDWSQLIYVWVANDFYEWRFRETPFASDPRGARPQPINLFDFRDLWWRLTDAFAGGPDGLTGDDAMAWNRHRYADHFRLIEALNADGNLTVVLTYVRPQLDAARYEPQRRLAAGLERLGVPVIETLEFYEQYRLDSGDPFVTETDHVHFHAEASGAWSKAVADSLRQAGVLPP